MSLRKVFFSFQPLLKETGFHEKQREKSKFFSSQKTAFSLIEILVVLCIISILAAIAVPALRSSSSARLDRQTSHLSGLLEQARQHAVSQNTYVWVLFSNKAEFEGKSGMGVLLIASREGNDPVQWKPYSILGNLNGDLSPLGSIHKFEFFDEMTWVDKTDLEIPLSATKKVSESQNLAVNLNLNHKVQNQEVVFDKSLVFTPAGQAQISPSIDSFVVFAIRSLKDTKGKISIFRIHGLMGTVQLIHTILES